MVGRERQPGRNGNDQGERDRGRGSYFPQPSNEHAYDQGHWQSQSERGRGRGSYFPQPSNEHAYDQGRRQSQGERGRGRGSYFPQPSNEHAYDQGRRQSQGEGGRGRMSYFSQPSNQHAHFPMAGRERQPDRKWNDQDAGRRRDSYYSPSSNERAHSSQSRFSLGERSNEIDSRYGRNGGNGEARDRAMPSSDQYPSSRSSSRDTYYRGSINFRNGENSRRQQRDHPMRFDGNSRRSRSREGHGTSDDRTIVENGASSYRVQPMEFENACVGSSSSNGASNQQYDAASNNRREAAALERMALAKSTGLVPGNHVITPITRQVASKQGTSGTKVNLVANYFRVTERSTWQLYLYTISVPAVCQYAHKLAFLVGNFGLTPPSNDLQRRLYFL